MEKQPQPQTPDGTTVNPGEHSSFNPDAAKEAQNEAAQAITQKGDKGTEWPHWTEDPSRVDDPNTNNLDTSGDTEYSHQADDPVWVTAEPSERKPETVITKPLRGQAEDAMREALGYFKNSIEEETTFSPDDGRPILPSESVELAYQKLEEAKDLAQKAEEEEKARERRIKDYLKQYPNAVVDEDKARYMATMGDEYETEAAKKEREAVKYLDKSYYGFIDERVVDPEGAILTPDQLKEEFKKMISEAEKLREEARKKEQIAGAVYDISSRALKSPIEKQKWIYKVLNVARDILDKLS